MSEENGIPANVKEEMFLQTLKDIKKNTDKVPALIQKVDSVTSRCDGRKDWIEKNEKKTEKNEDSIKEVEKSVENIKGKFWIIPIITSAVASAVFALLIALLMYALKK